MSYSLAPGATPATVVGIDFGTDKSIVALFDLGEIDVVLNDISQRFTPSCVRVDSALSPKLFQVGAEAVQGLIAYPRATVRGVKRRLLLSSQTSVIIPLDNTDVVSMGEIVQAILLELKISVEKTDAWPSVQRTIIAVPAYMTVDKQNVIRDAAIGVGFPAVELIEEAAALAIHYRHSLKVAKETVVFADIGCQGSILVAEVEGDRVKVLSTSEVLPGGEDFDTRLISHLLQCIKVMHNTTVEELRDMAILRSHCLTAKEKLSRLPCTSIAVYLPGCKVDLKIEVTRANFEDNCESLFETIINGLHHTLEKAKITSTMIDKLVLFGGSIRIPRLRTMLQEALPKAVCPSSHLEEAVAFGAAYFGALYQNKPSGKAIFRPWEKTPEKEEKPGNSANVGKPETPGKSESGAGMEGDTSDGEAKPVTYSLDMKDVMEYKKGNGYPKSISTEKKANFRRQCRPFYYHEGKLYYMAQKLAKGTPQKEFDVSKSQLVVLEEDERRRLVKELHEGASTSKEAAALSSHRGRDKLQEVCRYYWPGMAADARDYCRTCETCQKINPATLKVSDPMHPVGVPSRVMSLVGIDLCKLPLVNGMQYLAVAIDYFSKWPEARPISDKRASTVARFFL